MAPDEVPQPTPNGESLWLATTPRTKYPPLAGDLHVDVAVIGGGITGLSAAINLRDAGRSVAVIEADRIVEGTTGHTTAKLTSQHGLVYDHLCSTQGLERARQYAEANQAAIGEVRSRINHLEIDADFQRMPAFVYARSAEDVGRVQDEVIAARRLDLPVAFVDEIDAPFDVAGAIRFDDQAQFHPRKYLLSIAEAIDGDDGYIFENTRATDLKTGRPNSVETNRGTVTADHVVVASLFPFADRAGYFARMHPSRAYLLAVELEGEPPNGMFLSTDSPPWTFRPHPTGDGTVLLVGGQSHKPRLRGPSAAERYRRCESFARRHFDVESVRYRWSAHDYVPVDDIPFIGELGPRTDEVYVATGFNKWGMTGGTAAGMIIADLIVTGSNPWTGVFNPMRFSPNAVGSFLKQNTKVGARWFGDRVTGSLSTKAEYDRLDPGEGTVVRRRGRPIAVHRDGSGELSAVSAVCPHLWCIVSWNGAESTWDCPCHGSRFEADGTVMYGPALEDLAPRDL